MLGDQRARLLATTRHVDARARLGQASRRHDFLVRVGRVVSAVQHPARALDAVVSLLTTEAVEFAQVEVAQDHRRLYSAAVAPEPSTRTEHRYGEAYLPVLERVADHGSPEHLPLETAGPSRDEIITEVVAAPEVRERLALLGPDSLLVLPLSTAGAVLGTMTVARRPGYAIDDSARAFLEDVADQVAAMLHVSLVVAEARRTAALIRGDLRPSHLPEHPHVEIAFALRLAHPGLGVGGDFIDVHGPEDDLTFVIGDVAGKGLEAAGTARRVRHAVRTAGWVDRDPGAVLTLVNRVLVDEAAPDSEELCTAVVGRLRPTDDGVSVDLAGAGHPAPLVTDGSGTVSPVILEGPSLALREDPTYPVTTVRLAPGDLLLAHTDGVTEARRGGELYGDARLRDHLLRGGSPGAVVEALEVSVDEFLGSPPRDDLAVLALRVRERS
jgi:sigma-B regulation protein RsbU (phosphoserine phosphatase)